MKTKILTFGIARDIVGGNSLELDQLPSTVGSLREMLGEKFPQFNSIKSYAVAVNETYAEDDQSLHSSDTIVIIPPVSGG